jgi:LacI family transcriptional regulator
VPDEVAVTGFDDTVLATASRPQLTTVRQPLDLLGRAAVGLLRRAIQEPRMPARSTVLPAELVVRESSVRSNLPAKLPRTM